MQHENITGLAIRCFFNVYNTLGYGFLEKVYERALSIEMEKHGLLVRNQVKIDVYYEDNNVGQYFADIVLNDVLIIEVKAMEALREEHEYQLINYLKATEIEVGLLFNFGKKPSFKRKIFSNNRKLKIERR